MASIKHRGNGKWQAQVRRRGNALTRTFIKKSDAIVWARDQEASIDSGKPVRSNREARFTLADGLERYVSTVTLTKRGYKQEQSRIGMLRNHKLSKRAMADIRGSDFAEYRDERLGLGLSAGTVVRELAVLSNVFNVARTDWGMESLSNPARLMRMPKVIDDRDRLVLSSEMVVEDGNAKRLVDELEVIKHFSASSVLPTIVDLAVDTAMRRGEIASLRWEHVIAADGYIYIPRTHTKGQRKREVPVSDDMMAKLLEMPGRAKNGSVFLMRSDSIGYAFRRAAQRGREAFVAQSSERDAELDTFLVDLHFHDLRHEATTRLAAIFDAHELAKITGHLRLEMLLRYYHPKGKNLAMKRRTAEALTSH